jgi:hypothetical protein
MSNIFQIRLDNGANRSRKIETLAEVMGCNKTRAVMEAVEFYLRMHGDTTAVPTGAFAQLMERADEQGSVTAEEIAALLDTDALPVEAQTSWSVGEE